MRRGKQPQKKVSLPDGWWLRLQAISDKWEAPARVGDTTVSHLDVYALTKISRRTFSTARKTSVMTEPMFRKLARQTGYNNYEDLLIDLQSQSSNPDEGRSPDSMNPSSDTKLKQAQELVDEGKGREARQLMVDALNSARANKNEEQEAEALIALVLSSSQRRGGGDSEYYFNELNKKEKNLTTPAGRALFHRARAARLREQHDEEGAARAYEDALAACEGAPEDAKQNNGIQACVSQADYVHLLCSLNRLDEAKAMLIPCVDYARKNPELENGALLHLALEAAIHLALEMGDQHEAINCIAELEGSATTVRLADRVGGDLLNVANQCSHRAAHDAALAAAQASIRLGRRAQDREGPNFLVGAFYTEAMVLLRAGKGPLALAKAEAVLDFCNNPNDAAIKQATHHLIAEIRRLAGEPQAAVDLAQAALRLATGNVEEVAFAKLALARSLADNGQTEEALKHAREGWHVIDQSRLPPKASLDFLSHIVDYAAQLGMENEAGEALVALCELPVNSEEVAQEVARIALRAEAITKMRDRIIEVAGGNGTLPDDPAGKCHTVQEGNAEILRPLLNWWDEVLDAPPASITGAYEFWGRGNFVRVLENLRRFPRTLNVTLEVRSLDDLKRSIRMWSMYADVLILLWKGPMESAWDQVRVPWGTSNIGGLGYTVFPIKTVSEDGVETASLIALGQGTTLPAEVAQFLATEARPFVEAGRLIVVPAVGAACVSPGHGVFEQLIAQAANAVPGIRTRTNLSAPIGAIPHSPDVPFSVLSDLIESEADRLRKLRLLLLRRTRDFGAVGEMTRDAHLLELEIAEAIADATDATARNFSRRGFGQASEP